MANLNELDLRYLAMTFLTAQHSKCARKKTGALLVANMIGSLTVPRVLADGVNGTVPGDDRRCELPSGETDPRTAHAECNCLNKVLHHRRDVLGASTLYSTNQPCGPCATEIIVRGVGRVVWALPYKDPTPIESLVKAGVVVMQYSLEEIQAATGLVVDASTYDLSGSMRERGYEESDINKYFSYPYGATHGKG